MAPISVAMVEDDTDTRQRFARIIAAEPSLNLSFATGWGRELMAWIDLHPVDVALIDLGLPDVPGLSVIAHCHRSRPSCGLLVLTMFGDEANMLTAFEAGARGYLLKDGTEDMLAGHVLSLHLGGSPMSPIIARQLLARWCADRRPPAEFKSVPATPVEAGLSPREYQVLDLIARGFTYQEIATRLQIGLTTIHTHVRHIYDKLDVHNRSEAVFEARKAGWLG